MAKQNLQKRDIEMAREALDGGRWTEIAAAYGISALHCKLRVIRVCRKAIGREKWLDLAMPAPPTQAALRANRDTLKAALSLYAQQIPA